MSDEPRNVELVRDAIRAYEERRDGDLLAALYDLLERLEAGAR